MFWKESAESPRKLIRLPLRFDNLKTWIVLLLTGILLLIFSLPVSKKDRQTEESGTYLWQEDSSADSLKAEQGDGTEEALSGSALEKRLESLLSSVNGVGKVRVLLMTEEQKADYFETGSIKVTGVLIAAQGADNPVTVQNIKDAVMALFQVEAHKIKIMKMK